MAGVPELEPFVPNRLSRRSPSLPWRDGAPPPQPAARRHLPRLDAWRLPHLDLPRRRGSPDVHAAPRLHGEAPQLARALLLPDGHALPPRPGVHARGALGRHAPPERRLRAAVQPPPPPPRPPLRRPVLLDGDRIGGAARGDDPLRPAQSRPGGHLRARLRPPLERRLDRPRPSERARPHARPAAEPGAARGRAGSRRGSSRPRSAGSCRSACRRRSSAATSCPRRDA
jgi:hypothetical protein